MKCTSDDGILLQEKLVELLILVVIGSMPVSQALTTGNLLRNGDFSQMESDGRPSMWDSNLGQGNTSIIILPRKYLDLHAVQISVYTNETLITLTQTFDLELNTNKSFVIMTFWYSTWIIHGLGSVHLDFYNNHNKTIKGEYIKTLASNLTWTRVHVKRPIPSMSRSAKVIIKMDRCMGKVLFTNFSIEQVDSWQNTTLFISRRSDGTLFIQWNLANDGFNVSHYDIYRGIGVLSSLGETDFLVTIPTMSSYGKNIYESMYTDHTVRLNTIYTYQVIARDRNRTIIDQTILEIGQPDLEKEYHNTTILLAFPRLDGIHLTWKLPSQNKVNNVTLYQDIDRTQRIGTFPAEDMKVIVSLLYHGPFLLVSDNGEYTATATLANLTRPRILLTPTRLAYIQEKIQQSEHAQEMFKELNKSIHSYRPDNLFHFCWPARDAALLYAITKDTDYIRITYSKLNINRQNYTIYDNSGIKLLFARSTMARAQAFDWAYDGFTVQQREELVKDFQYAASIFTSYTDDHSGNPNDKSSNWVGIVKSSELILHLALYGEEGYPNDQAERRILFLLNELKLHLDHAYGSSGYTQEGPGYLANTIQLLGPAIYSAQDMGISLLNEAWSRPDWHNLALHILSFRKKRYALQSGVSDSTYSYNGFLPYIFNSTNDTNIKAALRWLYDRTMGINSSSPAYDGKDRSAALLYYPYEIPAQHPNIGFIRSTSMLIDNIDGYYVFRNRYQDENDILIGFSSRNRCHVGWNAEETFALSIISHDTTWARMPGKEYKDYNLTRKFSTPLIDGRPREPPRGNKNSYIKLVKAFDDQGGGYVSVDASRNFQITLAQRNLLVDMMKRDNVETIIAIDDQFEDKASHSWHWQLSPDPVETNFSFGYENQLLTFVVHGKNRSWLKGWLYNSQNTTYNNTNESIQMIKYGRHANFRIVIALGSNIEPIAYRTANGIRLGNVLIDFNTLSKGLSPIVISSRLDMIIIATSVVVSLLILLSFSLSYKKEEEKRQGKLSLVESSRTSQENIFLLRSNRDSSVPLTSTQVFSQATSPSM